RAQSRNRHKRVNWRSLLEQYFSAEESRRLPACGVVVPEALDSFLLSHDHMRAANVLGEARENCDCFVVARFDEHCMSNQSHAFQIAQVIPASVESASIEPALDSVVADETVHHNGVKRTLCEETKDFGFVFFDEFMGEQRSSRTE